MRIIDIEELKRVQLDILKNVHVFCQQNHITYFLAYGTLIGAVRHKGFIPWDDDIDIVMPRRDYEKFVREFSHEDNSSQFYVLAPEINKQFPLPYGKVVDSRSVLIESVENPYPMGVNIDLFPLDISPEDKSKAYKIMRRTQRWSKFYVLKNTQINNTRVLWKNIVLQLSHLFLWPLNNSVIIKKILSNAKANMDTCSPYYGMFVQCSMGKGYHMPQKWFESVVELPFEDYAFNCPVGYDEFLKEYYGDYMQMPPIDKRVSHHAFKAYWKK